MSFTVEIYSFTEKGYDVAKKIVAFDSVCFREEKVEFHIADGKNITNESFHSANGHIFICATGIAVRKIAPFLESKLTDPAVIVIDECERFVIPILSGHIGGGNEFADIISEKIGATSVITTATDINGYMAIDSIAATNGMMIKKSEGIKRINAKILSKEEIVIACDEHVDVIISSDKNDSKNAELHLYNKRIVLGIGCRKDTDVDVFEETINSALADSGLLYEDVWKIASIDIKSNERAITEYANKYSIKFVTYSAKELSEVEGDFDESSFVKDITGVSNVSERAAFLCGGQGNFIEKRIVKNGITISIFEAKKTVNL